MQYLLIEELEEFEIYVEKISKIDKTQELTIIINSWWWANILREFMYTELKDLDYHIQVYQACSNALVLFDLLKDKAKSITISSSAILMAHISKWGVDIWDWWKPRWDYEKHKFEMQKIMKPHIFSFLTKEQNKKYLNWEDVYILPKQLW